MRWCGKIWYRRIGHTRQNNMAHAYACWITQATDTNRMCNTYCFSTATVVTGTRLNVTLYLYFLSCFEYSADRRSTSCQAVSSPCLYIQY